MKKELTAALLAGVIIAAAGCTGTAKQTTARTSETVASTEAVTTAAESETATTTATTEGAATAGSDRKELSLTDESFRELNHKLFLANQQEAIFEKHKSMYIEYINDFQLTAEDAYAYYITPDSHYSEAPNWIDYYKDRVEYNIDGLKDPETAIKSYLIDFRYDWTSYLWRYVSTDENLWYDYDHDDLTDAYTEDGHLYLFTRFDEAMSRGYCENMVGAPYEGEIYTTESIYDEKTYEMYAIIIRKELNGSSEIVNTVLFEYDTDEPASCRLFRMMFAQSSEEKVTVSVTAYPDTEREISRTVSVIPNCSVMYACDDMSTIKAFEDRECTVPHDTPWDRVSDLTMYLKNVTE